LKHEEICQLPQQHRLRFAVRIEAEIDGNRVEQLARLEDRIDEPRHHRAFVQPTQQRL
jgi:hypothetical protein